MRGSSRENEPAAPRADEESARLLDFLVDRDVFCPVCRYNLRNLKRTECPECHQALVLTVGITKLGFGWFLAAVTPGLFSGICALVLVLPMIFATIGGAGPIPLQIIGLDAFGWLSGIAALVLIGFRYRFVRLPVIAQRWTALIIWLVHLTAFSLMVVAMT